MIAQKIKGIAASLFVLAMLSTAALAALDVLNDHSTFRAHSYFPQAFEVMEAHFLMLFNFLGVVLFLFIVEEKQNCKKAGDLLLGSVVFLILIFAAIPIEMLWNMEI